MYVCMYAHVSMYVYMCVCKYIYENKNKQIDTVTLHIQKDAHMLYRCRYANISQYIVV